MKRTGLPAVLALAAFCGTDLAVADAGGVVPGGPLVTDTARPSSDVDTGTVPGGSLAAPVIARLVARLEGAADPAPPPVAPSPAAAFVPAVGGDPDVLLYVQPVSHEHVRYDVAAGRIERLGTSPTLDGIDVLTLCSYYHYFAAQPVTGAVTAEVSHCELDDGDYWEQASVVIRDASGVAREVFGVPGYAYGPPRVSFDGRLLAMRGRTPDERQGGSDDGKPGLFVMGVDGTLLSTLNTPTADVRWLADNRLLVVSPSGRGLRISSPVVDGQARQGYATEDSIDPLPDRNGTITSVDVSAGSRRVVFGWREAVDAVTARDEVYTLELDSRAVRLVASTPDYVVGDGVSGLIAVYGIRSVSWSPSGDAVYVYMGGRTGQLPSNRSGYLLKLSVRVPDVIPLVTGPITHETPRFEPIVPTLPPIAPAPGLEQLRHQRLYGLALWPVTDYYPVAGGVR